MNVTFSDKDALLNFTIAYFKLLPKASDTVGSGYWFIDPFGYILQNGKPVFVGVHYFFNHSEVAPIENLFLPLYEFAKSLNASSIANITAPIPQARYVFPQPGGHDPSCKNTVLVLGSRMDSRRNLLTPDGASNLTNAIKQILTNFPIIIEGHLTAGGQVARNANISSGLNPSWREALGQIIIPLGYDDNTAVAMQEQMMQSLTNVQVPILAAVDPSMGAYTNEADPNEGEWQSVFWGSNYARLLEIKNRWDPRGVFRCNRCVGSEGWVEMGTVLRNLVKERESKICLRV